MQNAESYGQVERWQLSYIAIHVGTEQDIYYDFAFKRIYFIPFDLRVMLVNLISN